ncbi:MAG: hypothetical protein E7271_10265 [Lachnospiraceae bacterium]|jgi:hypothetical protein|nr:hypothetical protein [Lachnospiraceae bacterium]
MFGIYFGKYLVDQGIISHDKYNDLVENTKNSKVQMGLLAVETGLMTEEQTREVNLLQQQEDKRFGDIAIDKGYLTETDVSDLLDRQGDSYLLFIQALLENDVLTMDQIREELVNYRKYKGLSTLELEAIKTGDVDRIIPIFVKDDEMPSYIKDYIMLTSRNIVRFVDRFFRMEKIERITEYDAIHCATQHIVGDYRFYTALCGNEEGIGKVARGFASKAFDNNTFEQSVDTLDAVNEFLNCNNGLFVTGLSDQNVSAILESPVMKKNHSILKASAHMYKVPLFVEDESVDLIVCYDENFDLSDK